MSTTFNAYITQALSTANLQQDEELTLIIAAQSGDAAARERLITSHVKLVVGIARQVSAYSKHQFFDDLVQCGTVGLVESVDAFDVVNNSAVRFCTFAAYRIRSAMLDHVLSMTYPYVLGKTKQTRKVFFNVWKLLNGRRLTQTVAVEIAETLNVPVRDVINTHSLMTANYFSLNADHDDDANGFGGVEFHIPAAGPTPDQQVSEEQFHQKATSAMHKAMSELSDRQRFVIEHRWMRPDPPTLTELAAEMGVSAERVRQIETKSLKHMKARMEHLQ